jgi:hypothetical protein
VESFANSTRAAHTTNGAIALTWNRADGEMPCDNKAPPTSGPLAAAGVRITRHRVQISGEPTGVIRRARGPLSSAAQFAIKELRHAAQQVRAGKAGT